MDMRMISKDSSNTAAGASAHRHHNKQEAMGKVVEAKRKVKPARKPATARKPRPQIDEALRCPRCDSDNTKFCYYNNYNINQPRYCCKACNRYWTQGGSLRNVPVGGGRRKPKLGSSSPSSGSADDQDVLTTYSSIGFDLPGINLPFTQPLLSLPSLAPTLPLSFPSLAPAAPLSSTSLAPVAPSLSMPMLAPPLTPDAGIASFLDMLGGGLLDNHSSGMETPAPFGFDPFMQDGVVGGHGDEAPIGGGEGATAATTQQGGPLWPTAPQVAPNQQEDGASAAATHQGGPQWPTPPDTAMVFPADDPWQGEGEELIDETWLISHDPAFMPGQPNKKRGW